MPGKGLFPFHIATGPVYWCMWAAPYQATLWEYATVLVIACVYLVIGLWFLWYQTIPHYLVLKAS